LTAALPQLNARTLAFLNGLVDERRRRRIEKRCPRCGKTKPLSEFNRNRTRADGVQQYCRACWNAGLDAKKSQMAPAARHRWEHDRYMRHRRKNVDRHWRNWNRRRVQAPALYLENIDREFVYLRDNGCCRICGERIDLTLPTHHADSFTIDHIEPVSAGGEHSYENVRAAHLRCNVSEMWRQRKLRRAGRKVVVGDYACQG
jgi:hypothetical protein